jgi:opacity protein-like surface antigen
MKPLLTRMLLLSFLAGGAMAQNSDLAILFGANGPTSGTVGNGVVTGQFGVGFQINFSEQLHETAAGQLYVEVPLMIATHSLSTVSNSVVNNEKDSIYFTPGVRWRFTPQKRISFYAAAGAGIGSFGTATSFVGMGVVSNTNSRDTTFAFGFGGGIDFRLTRLLSLRAEGRDFVTRAGLGETGRNHAFFMAGIGFHF